MLNLVENIQSAVEPVYTFGVNALEHGKTFVLFLSQGLTSVYNTVENFVPSFIAPVVLLSVGTAVTVHVIKWG